ncbi:uncharacterized protein LOC131430340 [Malaya genurostris]|uniref:uncharacterized protein LOC131430340 n=1 Tax=Malaya genurostris TaxID=325434 RepID=UPI0026F3B55B|nr:uncharacterized protein LOC131430340 [Malaya genurostris]
MSYKVCSLFVLFLMSTALLSQYTEEAIDYELCHCPCTNLAAAEIESLYQGNNNCVVFFSTLDKGLLYSSDQYFGDIRRVYQDISGEQRYPYSAYWKIYYPWRNVSDTDDVPLVIQNIQTQEYMMASNNKVAHKYRVVATYSALIEVSLWLFYDGRDNKFRIQNQIVGQWLFGDDQYKDGWDEGKMLLGSMDFTNHDEIPEEYEFFLHSCRV